ncbi:MAG: hypothetical protein ACI9G6_001872, partial [Limisphaerales bacterium]
AEVRLILIKEEVAKVKATPPSGLYRRIPDRRRGGNPSTLHSVFPSIRRQFVEYYCLATGATWLGRSTGYALPVGRNTKPCRRRWAVLVFIK